MSHSLVLIHVVKHILTNVQISQTLVTIPHLISIETTLPLLLIIDRALIALKLSLKLTFWAILLINHELSRLGFAVNASVCEFSMVGRMWFPIRANMRINLLNCIRHGGGIREESHARWFSLD